jgi:DNA replication protein DnaC
MQQLRTLLSGDFVDRRENILVFGPPGSGKTHSLCALAQELVRTGRRFLFTTTALLVQELLAAKRDLKLKALFKRLARWEALILDDLGYVQQSREEMEVLFTLLAERYERGSVCLTSNLAFSKWEQVFKDPMTTAAAVDRLVHHSVIVELNVPSYRAEAAKQAKSKASWAEQSVPTIPAKEHAQRRAWLRSGRRRCAPAPCAPPGPPLRCGTGSHNHWLIVACHSGAAPSPE